MSTCFLRPKIHSGNELMFGIKVNDCQEAHNNIKTLLYVISGFFIIINSVKVRWTNKHGYQCSYRIVYSIVFYSYLDCSFYQRQVQERLHLFAFLITLQRIDFKWGDDF